MVTVRDVAQDAGVSVGTVSNVINGVRVGEARKKRVENSISKLGYQVNTPARGMRIQQTDYVVIILPNLTNPYFALLLGDLERELSEAGKYSLLCISDAQKEKEIRYIEMARHCKVDGIIGITYSDVEKYVEDSLPFVSIERHFKSNIPCVASDNFRGGYLAAENLCKRGAKNLLFIQIISSIDNEVRKRRSGFEQYCEEHGVNYNCVEFSEQRVSSIYSSFSSRTLVHDVLKAYLGDASEGTQIDGIFAGTDHLAVVARQELQQMGFRVPEDVQIIGYDGLKLMNSGAQLVSSIYQNTRLIAKTGVDCLIRLIRQEEAESVVNLEVSFVDGGTTLPLM
ncbi:MAG: LacI family DNA-binding transcriptional regulator [Lachnospiraceae bacterium]|nr:LacI family DNA-binding transcriptional regulator [Lachnospiraceae bacterium]